MLPRLDTVLARLRVQRRWLVRAQDKAGLKPDHPFVAGNGPAKKSLLGPGVIAAREANGTIGRAMASRRGQLPADDHL